MKANTREFESSHGKKPRGFGRWAFWMGEERGRIEDVHFFTGKFADAKNQDFAKAKELGFPTVTVGS